MSKDVAPKPKHIARSPAPHQKAYKPKAHHAHHSTAHLPGAVKTHRPKHAKHHAKRYTTVRDVHHVPTAPSAATAVKNLHAAIDQLEKVETELLTVKAALRLVRKPKAKAKRHAKPKTKKRIRL